MRRIFNWQVILGIILVSLSALGYYIHFLVFRDFHHIMLYLIGDIAFVFVEVLLVTMVIHQLLTLREKKQMLKKLNMVIGAFYSEVGTPLLSSLSKFDPHAAEITSQLIFRDTWSKKDFLRLHRSLTRYECAPDVKRSDLVSLKDFLLLRRSFMLRLLENPNLLEHESFSELLWAVFHLTEELSARGNIKVLEQKDAEHLANDVKRAYTRLIAEWIAYMGHLKSDYPYLFSLAMRTNPFDPKASVELS